MGGICSMETLEKILPCIKSSEAQNANLAKDGEDVVRYVRADQLWEADENQLAGDKPAAMPEENKYIPQVASDVMLQPQKQVLL